MEVERIYVINRSGEKENVRFDKISDRNGLLCSAAYGRDLCAIDISHITQLVTTRFRNGMTTHDLDMETISVCASLSTNHRDYSSLAARLVISNLHKKTNNSFVKTMQLLSTRLSNEFISIVNRFGQEIDSRIDYGRDYKFSYFGIETMKRSYLLHDNDTVERPQHAYMRVALAIWCCREDKFGHLANEKIARDRLEAAFHVYDLLSQHFISHASPTMFNAGTKLPQLSSCFLLSVDDDLDVLYEIVKSSGLISKCAGGIGIGLTRMRAKDAYICGSGGKSSGIENYIMLHNASQRYANQGGVRPGAFAMYLEVWHDDIFTHLEMGRLKGPRAEQRTNAPDLKYGLWVPDRFMEALEDELLNVDAGDWYLFSPDEAPGLEAVFDESRDRLSSNRAFSALYDKYISEGRYRRKVKAGDIIKEWAKTVGQIGNPYIGFKDAINRKSNLSHVRTITQSNLCVSADTLILTDQGHKKIGDLVDQKVTVWNGIEWSEITVCQTGRNCPMVCVDFDNGAKLICTPDHHFYLKDGTMRFAINLKAGDTLEKCQWPIIYDGEFLEFAYSNGIMPVIDKNIFSASIFSKVLWVEGYCNGVNTYYNSLGLQIPKSNETQTIRLLLQTMGCNSNGLIIPTENLIILKKLGFNPRSLRGVHLDESVKTLFDVSVVSVTRLDEKYNTFCFTEPKRNRGVFNGILTGQCIEVTIPSWHDEDKIDEAEYGVCNLGAINLAAFVVSDASKQDGVRFEFQKLIDASKKITVNLDNIIDINFYPREPCKRSNMRHRPIGVGTIGLADVFARFKYAFGSDKAKKLDSAIHACIYYGCMYQSSLLGAKYGSHSSWEGSPAQRGLLQPDLWVMAGDLDKNWESEIETTTNNLLLSKDWVDLRSKVQKSLRNGYVTALMPTATSSNVVGSNECFEPFTTNLYTRKTLAGEFTMLNNYLFDEIEKLNLWNSDIRSALLTNAGSVQSIELLPEELRLRYKTAREINQCDITLHAAARNPFVSQSMSLNYYFGELTLSKLLTVIMLGWKKGLTTGSYYIHSSPAAGSQKIALGACTKKCTSCSI
jgi:ribonucleotide reductase alpha subunit